MPTRATHQSAQLSTTRSNDSAACARRSARPTRKRTRPREAPEPSAGGADSRRVRVDPAHDRLEAGEPQRQPPVAAANLEHMLASPLGDALERAHLPLLRVDT